MATTAQHKSMKLQCMHNAANYLRFIFSISSSDSRWILCCLLAAVCGGELYASSTEQFIESPGYTTDRHYQSQQECTWLIKVTSQTQEFPQNTGRIFSSEENVWENWTEPKATQLLLSIQCLLLLKLTTQFLLELLLSGWNNLAVFDTIKINEQWKYLTADKFSTYCFLIIIGPWKLQGFSGVYWGFWNVLSPCWDVLPLGGGEIWRDFTKNGPR